MSEKARLRPGSETEAFSVDLKSFEWVIPPTHSPRMPMVETYGIEVEGGLVVVPAASLRRGLLN